MTLTAYKWTIEAYHQAIAAGCFADQPVELLKGEIILMAPEREIHAFYNSEVADYLKGLLGNRAKIRDAKPITLANDSEPVPDIAVVKSLGKVYLEHHPYAEDILWLIEFSKATLKKDLTEKKAIYGEAGIGEYWVVDLKNRALWVFRDWENGVYGTALRLSDGTVTPLAFQDIAIPVQVLMA